MVIGFSQRRVTVSEDQAPDEFAIFLNVTSERTSEQIYQVQFRVLEDSGPGVASVEADEGSLEFDARFGIRSGDDDAPIEDRRGLDPGQLTLESPLPVIIVNDFRPEGEECFTISVVKIDQEGRRETFDCNEDDPNNPPTNFFCQHTVCIVDDDGEYHKSFLTRNWL